jgi:murein L,D-transpeptidase YcbB/YkuD
LNNKVIGPDKNKRKGSIKIVKSLGDNKLGLMVGRYQKDLKKGDVITNFRKNERYKDNNGAWATIENWDYLEVCNIDFTKLTQGTDDIKVLSLHSVLNSNSKTQVAKTGINSPGNESSLFTDKTTEAIKKFQKSKNISSTGVIDSRTSKELNKICNISMKVQSINKLN